MKAETRNAAVSRTEKNEHLTNRFMIQLTWGIVGILALFVIRQGYRSPAVSIYMQPIFWITTGFFAILALLLFTMSRLEKTSHKERFFNYSIFGLVCTLVSLWFALYNQIRPLLEALLVNISGQAGLTLNTFWSIRIPLYGIILYLVAALIHLIYQVCKK